MKSLFQLICSPRFLDRLEQVIATSLFIWLFLRLVPDDASRIGAFSILILISEGAVILFLILRRPTDKISMRFGDWAIAAGGTFTALMIAPGGKSIMPELSASLLIFGTLIHVAAKLSLWRSFGLVAANRGIRSKGIYALVRHPMYAGYMLAHLGYFMSAPTLWNLSIYAITWILLIMRIFAEERVLSQDPEYRKLQERVRYRLMPGLF